RRLMVIRNDPKICSKPENTEIPDKFGIRSTSWIYGIYVEISRWASRLENIMAERQGFEPWIPFGYTRFPSVRLKPLGHLSGGRRDFLNLAHSPVRSLAPPALGRSAWGALLRPLMKPFTGLRPVIYSSPLLDIPVFCRRVRRNFI